MGAKQLAVLYDGGCGLCRREIAYYRRLDVAGRIRWVDISEDQGELDTFGVPYEVAMARLHAITADGQVTTGAYAFTHVWSLLPYWHWLSRFLRLLRLVPALDCLYAMFAKWRLRLRVIPRTCKPGARRAKETGRYA